MKKDQDTDMDVAETLLLQKFTEAHKNVHHEGGSGGRGDEDDDDDEGG